MNEWAAAGTPWNKTVQGGMCATGVENPVLYNSIVNHYMVANISIFNWTESHSARTYFYTILQTLTYCRLGNGASPNSN